MKDKLPPHRFGPGYDKTVDPKTLNPGPVYDPFTIRTERPTMADDSVKRMLLDVGKKKEEPYVSDDRPLIDKLHEATFTDPVGLRWIGDKYFLRMLLRKAHCFTVDDVTSTMVADFSLAIAEDLETVRRMAIPPYPVTWIDLNNHARLKRLKELGVPLTDTAEGRTEAGEPVPRVGWLIHEASDRDGYYVHYCTEFNEGMTIAPFAYWWHNGPPNTPAPSNYDNDSVNYFHQVCTFGIGNSNVRWEDAGISTTPVHIANMKRGSQERELMEEIKGELRHVWGFLIALNSAKVMTTPDTRDKGPPKIMKNGKPLLPLEHKLLHLHLGSKIKPKVLIARAITQHRMREHDVRGHLRTLRNQDGSVRVIVPIKSHKRGDAALGRIEKTYKVEK